MKAFLCVCAPFPTCPGRITACQQASRCGRKISLKSDVKSGHAVNASLVTAVYYSREEPPHFFLLIKPHILGKSFKMCLHSAGSPARYSLGEDLIAPWIRLIGNLK